MILLSIHSVTSQSQSLVLPKTKWKTTKADWSKYQSLTEEYFSNNHRHYDNLNEKYHHFITGIEHAATASIPIKKPIKPKNHSPPPWWDSECDIVVGQRRQALRSYTNESTLENFITVNKEIARSRKIERKKQNVTGYNIAVNSTRTNHQKTYGNRLRECNE
nr:unnamed protein product [Callosobruchus analis]